MINNHLTFIHVITNVGNDDYTLSRIQNNTIVSGTQGNNPLRWRTMVWWRIVRSRNVIIIPEKLPSLVKISCDNINSHYLTRKTEQLTRWEIPLATLPRRSLSNPVRLWVPITIRSIFLSLINFMPETQSIL